MRMRRIYEKNEEKKCLTGNKADTASTKMVNIRKTCLCNVYPLEPHFYIAKLGYAGGGGAYLSQYFCSKNRLWVLNEAVLTCTHNLRFEQSSRNISIFSTENFLFYNQKNSVILRRDKFT